MGNDFEKALYKHGREYYFKNLNLPHDECYLKTSFIKNGNPRFIVPIRNKEEINENKIILMDFEGIEYELKFDFDNSGLYNVLEENITFHCDFYEVTNEDDFELNTSDLIDDNHLKKPYFSSNSTLYDRLCFIVRRKKNIQNIKYFNGQRFL